MGDDSSQRMWPVSESLDRLASELERHYELLEACAPPSVVVDRQLDVRHVGRGAARYLRHPGGPISRRILWLVHPELRDGLQVALRDAFRYGVSTSCPPRLIAVDDRMEWVHVVVRVGSGETGPPERALVLFVEVEGPSGGEKRAVDGQHDDEHRALRNRVQALTEDYETSVEELRAANEELEAANEQLRGASEDVADLNRELTSKVAALDRAHADLYNLIAATETGTLLLDRELAVKWYTPSAARLFHLRTGDIGRPVTDLAHELDGHDLAEDARRTLAGSSLADAEVRGRDGRWFLIARRPYLTLEGAVEGVLITFVDVTERKDAEGLKVSAAQLEQRARREQEFNKSLFETAHSIVLVLDPRGRIVRFNAFFESLTGWRLDEVRGRDWFEVFLPEGIRGETRSLFRRALSGERTRGHVNAVLTRDGRSRDIEWYDAPLTGPEGELVGLLCTGQDVTERRLLEREVLEIAAEEQRRIGQELHDAVGQELIGLGMLASTLATAAERGHAPDVRALRAITEGLRSADQQVRALSRGLCPVDVDPRGLADALASLARQVEERSGIACLVDAPDGVPFTDGFTCTHLFRIAQEATTNAVRHGRPTEIRIALDVEAGSVTLSVRDDGTGFDQDRPEGEGLGIRIMRYRAGLIGGWARIESARNGDRRGTSVACIVPIRLGSRLGGEHDAEGDGDAADRDR